MPTVKTMDGMTDAARARRDAGLARMVTRAKATRAAIKVALVGRGGEAQSSRLPRLQHDER